MADSPACSVVIPIYNEEDNIPELYARLTRVLEGMTASHEILFVDDGSHDRSPEILGDLHLHDRRIKVICFSRNFGHHLAIAAGLDYCRGETVILMDGDLQDPPEEIPKMYKVLTKNGVDTVYAVRKARKDPFLKKLNSYLFYKVFKILARVEIPRNTGLFRIMRRSVVEQIRSCRERFRFTPALITWTGFKHVGVETDREERFLGQSKYSFMKSSLLALDALVSFSYFPLRIATFLGFIVSFIGLFSGTLMLIKKIFWGMTVSGYASLIVSLLFLGGIQLLLMGLIGEYMGRIYSEVQNRPMYIIREFIGFADASKEIPTGKSRV